MKTLIALSLVSTVACQNVVEVDQTSAEVQSGGVRIYAPNESIQGKSYAEHSARFWEFAMEYPLDDGHQFLGTAPSFGHRQHGNTWYWGAPDGPAEFNETMPVSKTLYLTLRDVDCSTLEAEPFFGDTAEAQASCADFWADHLRNLFVVLNGDSMDGLEDYRFQSGQFKVHAPTPWIFAEIGGHGTASADGFYVAMDLPVGAHSIHYGGEFYFAPGELAEEEVILAKDITLNLTVE